MVQVVASRWAPTAIGARSRAIGLLSVCESCLMPHLILCTGHAMHVFGLQDSLVIRSLLLSEFSLVSNGPT